MAVVQTQNGALQEKHSGVVLQAADKKAWLEALAAVESDNRRCEVCNYADELGKAVVNPTKINGVVYVGRCIGCGRCGANTYRFAKQSSPSERLYYQTPRPAKPKKKEVASATGREHWPWAQEPLVPAEPGAAINDQRAAGARVGLDVWLAQHRQEIEEARRRAMGQNAQPRDLQQQVHGQENGYIRFLRNDINGNPLDPNEPE